MYSTGFKKRREFALESVWGFACFCQSIHFFETISNFEKLESILRTFQFHKKDLYLIETILNTVVSLEHAK